jgi:hypothetical protein
LVIGIIYDGVAFAIVCKKIPIAGNSSIPARIELAEQFMRLIWHCLLRLPGGRQRIDRGQVDKDLNDNRIINHIHIRENFWVFNHLKINQQYFRRDRVKLSRQLCYLSAYTVKNKLGRPELQIIAASSQSIMNSQHSTAARGVNGG